jgi:cytochrome c oxidase subunit 2
MKRKWTLLASTVLAASMLFAGCSGETKPAATTQSAAPASGENVVNIEASNWKFNQDRYEVKAGQPVTINFTSKEGVHGLVVDGLGIEIQQQGSKTFTPDKPGEYKMFCSIPCGPDHGKMTATLVVK